MHMIRRHKNIVLVVCIVGLFICLGFHPTSAIFQNEKSYQSVNTPISSGNYLRFIVNNGRIRSFRFHIPQDYNDERSVPIVFALHGWPSNSKNMEIASELDAKSNEEGFIVVYPNGHIVLSYFFQSLQSDDWELGWNFWNQDPNPADDVQYIKDLIAYFKNNFNVNGSRIYITGISGGACMSYRLGAELSETIAAIAPVAGTIGGIWDVPEPDDSIEPYIIPKPSNALPVIVFHGTTDEAVYYDGGWRKADNSPGFRPYGPPAWLYMLSVNESISFWINHNNCNPVPFVEQSPCGNIIKNTYENGDDNSEVVLYTIVDGGHDWFGSRIYRPYNISVNDEIWAFFESHPKNMG